jgi:hypothetical protein
MHKKWAWARRNEPWGDFDEHLKCAKLPPSSRKTSTATSLSATPWQHAANESRPRGWQASGNLTAPRGGRGGGQGRCAGQRVGAAAGAVSGVPTRGWWWRRRRRGWWRGAEMGWGEEESACAGGNCLSGCVFPRERSDSARCSWSRKYQAGDSAKCRAALYFYSTRENSASARGVYNARDKKTVIIARRYFSATAGDTLSRSETSLSNSRSKR